MNILKLFFILVLLMAIIACSPHPASGKWKAIESNTLALNNISILFDGKAEFTTNEKNLISWHCFWGAESKTKMSMSCTPSIDTEIHESYEFIVISKDRGQLSRKGKVIGDFSRAPYQ